MTSENREEFLTALRARRHRQGHVVGILTLECSTSSCPVTGEIRHPVNEAGRKLLQPPMKCPRCGQELYFLTLE